MNKTSSLKKWIPNAITCSRLLFFGAIIGFLVADNFRFSVGGHIVTNLHLVLALYFFGAMTDILDGAFARRWNVVSRLGDTLDHTVDKFFTAPGYYILWYYFWGIPVVIISLFEITTIIIGLNVLWKCRKGIKTNQFPNIFGKISYGFLVGTVCVVCLAVKWQPYWHSFFWVANGTVGLAILLRIASLIKYFRKT